MRYIKPPKQLSAMWWEIGSPLPRGQLSYAAEEHGKGVINILDYARTEGNLEYILDCRIFQSTLIRILLGQE